MKKAIFFDKDGTLIEDIPYNVSPEKIVFSKGADQLVSRFRSDYEFHIVSNQAGVAMGYFAENDLLPVKKRMESFFSSSGARLQGFHYCPHHPQGVVEQYRQICECRKPHTLMLEKACRDFQLDASSSWLIGDILDDIEAGNKMGMKTILLNIGNETIWDLTQMRTPDFTITDLAQALSIIERG